MTVERRAAVLRSTIEAKLRGTEAGGDPASAWIAGLPPEMTQAVRHLLPKVLRRAAVLVPLVERESGLNILLTQRATHLKNHAGQISFPGGRIEDTDPSPWAAALRETEEEIGLSREHVSLAGYLKDHVVITGYLVTPAVGFVRPGFELTIDREEVEDVFEVPLEFVLDRANHVAQERKLGALSFRTFDIPYQGRNIWGATAGMLMTLYRLLKEQ